ncbi:MAG: tRNA (adenosine(37)-N6)-threonylcarbamoyltransferase complex ATPase subunit type 1 TsaE [Hyphomicrobiales bacterium]
MHSPFLTLTLEDDAASNRLGEDIAPALRSGDCVLLSGDLGMGKTTIARALIRAFLDNDQAEVPSPTFTLVNHFEEGRTPLAHFDLYRITDPDELQEIGFKEALETGITLVEWPQQAPDDMPQDGLTLKIDVAGEGRSIAFFGNQRWAERITRTLQIRAFLDAHGWSNATRRFLQGDASARAYEKAYRNDGAMAVLMDAPAVADGPIVKDGKRYSQLAHLAEDVRPFVAIGEALRAQALPAPELYAYDLDAGLLLMQDFGPHTVIVDDAPDVVRYETALDILAKIHGHDWPDSAPLPDGSTHSLATFDQTVFDIEISLLLEWYAPHVVGTPFNEEVEAEYKALWQTLFNMLSTGEKSWFLRDYHSPNLMWRPDESGNNRIGLIDYQDALIGPSAYDVASLCQDARYTVPIEMEHHLKQRYIAARNNQSKAFDEIAFERDYAIIAAERGTRLLGLWPRLKYRDGKDHYMKHMPRTKEYLRRAFEHPILHEIKVWYADNLGL